jgi:L-threonylcarbamoyladenylate synthase
MALIRLAVDPRAIDARAILQAADVIRSGGIVAIPTDTLYGLAANPFDDRAIAALFEAKRRPPEQGIPLITADTDQAARTFGGLDRIPRRLADAFWPGPLTLLLSAPPRIAEAVASGTGRVGVRVPAHAVARALCSACGQPLTATSANISGEPATANPDDVARSLHDRIDMLLDAGVTPGGEPSTIVDATSTPPMLIRAGAIPWDAIEKCLRD